ncbi:hypothetical protein D9615_008382 [Tricholomella constricta]|uniref:Pentatricopeptide repeat domain-containing protein n=1 Tax=Tricholomella constricta TaxID=117010 RepID=A0A8H5HDQ5_9AGAR|nr:hypothetical protein D9615_008382 [Tricholomella constricta]
MYHLVSGTSTTHWLYNDPSPVYDSLELSNESLLNYVKDGKFGAAERLRLQLVEHGIEIRPHPAYEQAAIANLAWSDMEQCVNNFTNWFSLIPEYDKNNPPIYPGPFKDTRHVLMHAGSPSARLPLILRFGVISASKGYLQPMFHEILPILIRFASAEVGANWLHEMERAVVQYQSTANPREAAETARRYRAYGVEICCEAGWLDYAMSIVQLERDFTLPTRTYKLLIKLLQDAGRSDDIETIQNFFNFDASQSRSVGLGVFIPPPFRLGPLRPPGNHLAVSDEAPQALPFTASMEHQPPRIYTLAVQDAFKRNITRRNVAIQLRFFKRWLSNKSCPDSVQIIRFLSDYRIVGGSQRIITWLRHRALSASPYCGMAWMKAELRYHNVERNYTEILRLYRTYLDTASTSTLPGIFPSILTRLAKQHRLPTAPSPAARARARALPKPALRDRWLVLKPMIRLATGLPRPLATLQALYASYRTATAGVETFNREANEVLAAFVVAFGECASPDDAVRVLKDTGETPYLRQVETLAGVLARAGRVEEAMGLLRRIERGAEGRGRGGGEGMRVKGYDGKVSVAVPRLTTYGRVIEGFAEAGLLEPALEVERMMKRRFKYGYGLNRKLDEAMRGLWALEMDQALKQVR